MPQSLIPGTGTNTAATIIGLQQQANQRKAIHANEKAARRRLVLDAVGSALKTGTDVANMGLIHHAKAQDRAQRGLFGSQDNMYRDAALRQADRHANREYDARRLDAVNKGKSLEIGLRNAEANLEFTRRRTAADEEASSRYQTAAEKARDEALAQQKIADAAELEAAGFIPKGSMYLIGEELDNAMAQGQNIRALMDRVPWLADPAALGKISFGSKQAESIGALNRVGASDEQIRMILDLAYGPGSRLDLSSTTSPGQMFSDVGGVFSSMFGGHAMDDRNLGRNVYQRLLNGTQPPAANALPGVAPAGGPIIEEALDAQDAARLILESMESGPPAPVQTPRLLPRGSSAADPAAALRALQESTTAADPEATLRMLRGG